MQDGAFFRSLRKLYYHLKIESESEYSINSKEKLTNSNNNSKKQTNNILTHTWRQWLDHKAMATYLHCVPLRRAPMCTKFFFFNWHKWSEKTPTFTYPQVNWAWCRQWWRRRNRSRSALRHSCRSLFPSSDAHPVYRRAPAPEGRGVK